MRNIDIKAATSTYSQSHYAHTEKSGWGIGGSFGVTYDKSSATTQNQADGQIQSQNRSQVGSTNGNLTIAAGNNLVVSGSQLGAATNGSSQQGKVDLQAANSLALLAGTDVVNSSSSSYVVRSTDYILSRKRILDTSTSTSTHSFGSTLAGNGLNLQSGSDTILQGSSLNAGKNGIAIQAGGAAQSKPAFYNT